MQNKSNILRFLTILLLAVCITAALAFSIGKNKAIKESDDRQLYIQELNRHAIEKIILQDGPIYVIGHKSPDSDTVCSAIAYARLLNMLGYEAIPSITMPINKESEFILKQAGVETPEVLIDASQKNIFLVDHSEYSQAVEGLQDAHIVGVIDHHGIGSIYTGHQVLYEARPIGSTATIIWLDYLNYGLELDKQTAHILLGAVLSDTNNLTATTTTQADIKAIDYLSKIAQVDDPVQFYNDLHKESYSYEGYTDEEIFFLDYKEYETAGIKYGIAIVNAIDEKTADELSERMKNVISDAYDKVDVDLLYASVGIRENDVKIDRIIPADERSESVLKNAFPDYDEYNNTSYIYRKGLGRKSVFVPGLTDYLNAYPHE